MALTDLIIESSTVRHHVAADCVLVMEKDIRKKTSVALH